MVISFYKVSQCFSYYDKIVYYNSNNKGNTMDDFKRYMNKRLENEEFRREYDKLGNVFFIYKLTADTGLAPCIDDGLITLACCKGGSSGLRHTIGEKIKSEYKDRDIWVIAICGKSLGGPEETNRIVMWGRVESVLTLEEYSVQYPGRTDNLYSVRKGELIRNRKLSKVHQNLEEQNTDKNGKYALIFDKKFSVYFGKEPAAWPVQITESLLPYRKHKRLDEKVRLESLELLYECFDALDYAKANWFGKTPFGKPHNDIRKPGCKGCKQKYDQ